MYRSDRFVAVGNRGDPWTVVLAGGEGLRMRSYVAGLHGVPVPKQYCVFVGRRTMLRHTVDRVARFSPAERVLTVIGPGHRSHLGRADYGGRTGMVLEQPVSRGNLPALLLALCFILEQDPEATVVVVPSDHFIYPESRFTDLVRSGCSRMADLPGTILLFGAEPDSPETDYGWIVPGSAPAVATGSRDGDRIYPVKTFREKPGETTARALLASGKAYWNTLIVLAKAATMWELADHVVRSLVDEFVGLRAAIRPRRGRRQGGEPLSRTLALLYERIESRDISRDLIAHATTRTVVLPLRGVLWSDWGRPERIGQSLQRMRAIAESEAAACTSLAVQAGSGRLRSNP
jgi:mannose-1-phosphate guanylyltransferase